MPILHEITSDAVLESDFDDDLTVECLTCGRRVPQAFARAPRRRWSRKSQSPQAPAAAEPEAKKQKKRKRGSAVTRTVQVVTVARPAVLLAAASGPHAQLPTTAPQEAEELRDLMREDDVLEASCADCRSAGNRKSDEFIGVAKTTIQSSLDAVNAFCEDRNIAHLSPARHASVRAFAANLMDNLKNDGMLPTRCTLYVIHTLQAYFQCRQLD